MLGQEAVLIRLSDLPDTVRKELERIVFLFHRHCPPVISLMLVGGFAKGEGRIDPKGEPENDYDLLIVWKSARSFLLNFHSYRRLKVVLSQTVQTPVDIISLFASDFKRLKPTLFLYEAQQAHLLLSGRDCFAKAPFLSPQAISAFDQWTLFSNRIVCWLQSYPQQSRYDHESAYCRWVLLQWVKAVEAMVIFRLLKKKELPVMAHAKMTRILDLCPDGLAGIVNAARRIKEDGWMPAGSDYQKLWWQMGPLFLTDYQDAKAAAQSTPGWTRFLLTERLRRVLKSGRFRPFMPDAPLLYAVEDTPVWHAFRKKTVQDWYETRGYELTRKTVAWALGMDE